MFGCPDKLGRHVIGLGMLRHPDKLGRHVIGLGVLRRPDKLGRHVVGLGEAGRRCGSLIFRGGVERSRDEQNCHGRRQGQDFALVHFSLLDVARPTSTTVSRRPGPAIPALSSGTRVMQQDRCQQNRTFSTLEAHTCAPVPEAGRKPGLRLIIVRARSEPTGGSLPRHGAISQRGSRATETPRALGEWREILARPWPEIAALITDPRSPARSVRGRIERDFTPADRRTSRCS